GIELFTNSGILKVEFISYRSYLDDFPEATYLNSGILNALICFLYSPAIPYLALQSDLLVAAVLFDYMIALASILYSLV
ncbi:hypothetical protein V2J09_019279, partial [Rumex salicifolius]